MEHGHNETEELSSEPFDYIVPLNGSSQSLGGAEDENGESDRGADKPWIANNVGRDWKSHRRSSNQTDATPRFQNTTHNTNQPTLTSSRRTRPPIPLHIEKAEKSSTTLDKSQKSQKSLSSFISKNNSSSVSFNLVTGNDSISSQSLSFVGGSLPLTPTSNAASTFSKKTPELARRAIHQITMDGAIQEVPLTPQSRSTASSNVKSKTREQATSNINNDDDGENTVASESAHSLVSATGTEKLEAAKYNSNVTKDRDVGSVDTAFDDLEPIVCWNIEFPLWLSNLLRSPPSLSRISHCLVHVLPCFWCCGKATQGNSTDRVVLTRLNIVCILMTLVQLGAALGLATLLLFKADASNPFKGFAPHFWNINGAVFSVGILAFVVIITCACTIRVIREVDLVGAIRYLWVFLWLLPFEIFFNISLYDYHDVTSVWIVHWWREPQMDFFRGYFCAEGTDDNKCMVPINGGADFDDERDWCLSIYGDEDCERIRDEAQADMNITMLTFYSILAGWGSALLFIMLLMINSLERIISKPIVQKSRESNVPAWLSLPTLTNALVGSILLFSPSSLLSSSSGTENSWIGILYLIVAALFLVALLSGWYLSVFTIRNHADKQTKNVTVIIFIFVMTANALMLGGIFVICILISTDLISLPVDESQRGDVACRLDRDSSCTRCDAEVNRCIEWSLAEVTSILLTQLKQSATLSSIFILYAVSALRFGVTLRRHLSLYQIDYV